MNFSSDEPSGTGVWIDEPRPAALQDSAQGGREAVGRSWQRVRQQLRERLGSTTFGRWMEAVTLDSADEKRVVLAVPTRFLHSWVEARYGDDLRSLWRAEMPTVEAITLIVQPALADGGPHAAATAETGASAAGGGGAAADDSVDHSGLDSAYSFDNFVVGRPNEFAHAAAWRVAEDDNAPYNPLFIHGGVGLGKTHLMHAIGLAFRARRPEARVVYMTAERFMYGFIRALRDRSVMPFKETLRSVDLLLIDDVQFIGGKESTQEEFFHTFNTLVERKKQVVVSSDRSPGDLEHMAERLRSRLGCGLVAEVHATTYELRLGILQARAERIGDQVCVPPDVLEFLARNITRNVRELEGALTSLVAHVTLNGREITLDTCRETLRDKLLANSRRIRIEEIQKRVAEYFNVRVSDLCSPRRAQVITRPRHVAMYLAKELTSRSLLEIGRKFGNRDHTTVIHAVRRVKALRQTDPQFSEDVESLTRALEI